MSITFNEFIRRLKKPRRCARCWMNFRKKRAAKCELVNPGTGIWYPLCEECLDEF